MKVLVPGKEVIGWAKEYNCTGKGNEGAGCGASLLVEEDDLWYIRVTDYGGGTEVYYTFICEWCGCMTDVDHRHLPRHVMEKAETNNNTGNVSHVRSAAEHVKQRILRLRMKGGTA